MQKYERVCMWVHEGETKRKLRKNIKLWIQNPLNKWKLQKLKLTNIIDGNLENGNQKQNKRRIWKMIY